MIVMLPEEAVHLDFTQRSATANSFPQILLPNWAEEITRNRGPEGKHKFQHNFEY